MKRGHILLFIFAVILVLGVICALYPKDGILGLRFPSLSEIIKGEEKDTVPALSPEEIMAMRLRAIEEESFRQYALTDPSRFSFPNDSLEYFDALFTALEMADSVPVRILHWGDSQLEEDRITGHIRPALQEKFGGSGPGRMPFMRHYTYTMGVGTSVKFERYSVYGYGIKNETSNYGPFGDFQRIDTTATFTYYPNPKVDTADIFNRLTIYLGNVANPVTFKCGGVRQTVEPGELMSKVVFELPDSTSKVTVSVSGGPADCYGALLDNRTGVRMDNIAMRGCSGTVFTKMNREQIAMFCKEENVRLIIMQFGGNSVPVLKSSKLGIYMNSIKNQIDMMKQVAPQAAILFIGPSDMSTMVAGKRQTYPIIPELVDSLRSVANASGAAYWDLYGVMGGYNSMIEWVNATPPLARTDYIHFQQAGSARVSEIFCKTFFKYYNNYYEFRKH